MIQPPPDTITSATDTLSLDTHLLPAQVDIALQPPSIFYFQVDSALAAMRREGVMAYGENDSLPVVHPSLVQNTSYRPADASAWPLQTDHTPQSFAGILVIMLLALAAILRRWVPRRSGQYLLALFSQKQFNKFMAEEEPSWWPPMPLFLLSSALLIGGTVTLAFLRTDMFAHPVWYALTGTGFIAAMMALPVIRSAMAELLGAIFRLRGYTRLHANYSYLTLVFLGLLLLPVFLASSLGWLPDVQWAARGAIVCFIMALSYHFLRLLWQMRSEGLISLFYFFLYFCSLEILPLLLVYKLIVPYTR